MTNRYNAQAIRNELKTYIRHGAWNKFSCRFARLENEHNLAKAVVLRGHDESLVHRLCRCINQEQVVEDILGMVVRVTPSYLLYRPPTPLSIALGHDASPTVVQMLLICDDDEGTPKSLYVKNANGEIPLLQAIRLRADEEVVRLLVQNDKNRQSLLLCNKRKRIPLHLLAFQELSYGVLTDELEFMLFQTRKAIEMGTQRSNQAATTDCIGRHAQSRSYQSLRALVVCAPSLGHKATLRLLQRILHGGTNILRERLDTRDTNSLLHLVCQAPEWLAFAKTTKSTFLGFILAADPTSLVLQNNTGWLPLHLAIQSRKSWRFLQYLCRSSPQSLTQRSKRLALHLAIEYYPPDSTELYQIWKHYPSASDIPDGRTHLFAFQLAACQRDTERHALKDSAAQITSIFLFLQASLHLIPRS